MARPERTAAATSPQAKLAAAIKSAYDRLSPGS